MGREFSNALLGHDKTADIYQNSTKYDHPVLESICFYASENQDSDLLSYVNSVLEDKDISGFKLIEKDLNFSVSKYEILNGKCILYS